MLQGASPSQTAREPARVSPCFGQRWETLSSHRWWQKRGWEAPAGGCAQVVACSRLCPTPVALAAPERVERERRAPCKALGLGGRSDLQLLCCVGSRCSSTRNVSPSWERCLHLLPGLPARGSQLQHPRCASPQAAGAEPSLGLAAPAKAVVETNQALGQPEQPSCWGRASHPESEPQAPSPPQRAADRPTAPSRCPQGATSFWGKAGRGTGSCRSPPAGEACLVVVLPQLACRQGQGGPAHVKWVGIEKQRLPCCIPGEEHLFPQFP